jgi:hypothetical protein
MQWEHLYFSVGYRRVSLRDGQEADGLAHDCRVRALDRVHTQQGGGETRSGACPGIFAACRDWSRWNTSFMPKSLGSPTFRLVQ